MFVHVQMDFSVLVLKLLFLVLTTWMAFLCNQNKQTVFVSSVQFSGQDGVQMQMVVSFSFLSFSIFCCLRRKCFDVSLPKGFEVCVLCFV